MPHSAMRWSEQMAKSARCWGNCAIVGETTDISQRMDRQPRCRFVLKKTPICTGLTTLRPWDSLRIFRDAGHRFVLRRHVSVVVTVRLKIKKKKDTFVSCSRASLSTSRTGSLLSLFFSWNKNFCDQCIQAAGDFNVCCC